MNKTELIAAVAEKSGLSKKDAEKALNATIDTIIKAVAEGDKIQLTGFGTFEVRERGEKKCINPKTKQEMICPPCKAPAFKAGRGLKEAVNK